MTADLATEGVPLSRLRSAGFTGCVLIALVLAPAPAVAQSIDGSRVYVTDGDTIRLPNGDRVRLPGIDTAEMPPRAKCDREVRLALEAKARLQELIRGADRVTLRRPPGERDTDRYGRLLRDVLVDGRDAGEILVQEGLAQVWRGKRAEWCG